MSRGVNKNTAGLSRSADNTLKILAVIKIYILNKESSHIYKRAYKQVQTQTEARTHTNTWTHTQSPTRTSIRGHACTKIQPSIHKKIQTHTITKLRETPIGQVKSDAFPDRFQRVQQAILPDERGVGVRL